MNLILAFLFTQNITVNSEQSYLTKLCNLESSCRYSTENRLGYLGAYQFGHMSLIDLKFKSHNGKWLGKLGINSKEDFKSNVAAQETAIREWNKILDKRLKQCGASTRIDTTLHGIKLTQYNLRAASHLLGANYTCRFVHGEIGVRKDANGTSILDYLRKFR